MPCPDFDTSRCPMCPGDTNVVPPDQGYLWSGDLVFIGEAPGKDEDEKGRPFIGKTGKEFNTHYLRLAGLDREEIYITNTVKCRPRNNKTPDDKIVAACSEWHLKSEFRNLKPKVVVLMGATACSLVPEIDLEMHHGVPLKTNLYGQQVTVVPMWHPAAGLHDTKVMTPLREDFRYLGRVIRNGAGWIEDEYPNPDYRFINSKQDLKETLNRDYWLPLSMDTEFSRSRNTGFRKKPYCLSYSCEPGTGYVIMANRPDLLSEMARYVSMWKGQFLFHYPEADLSTLADMGINIPWRRVDDTLTRSYNLASMYRLGLKVLAYRLCGMEMQEFDDLVRPFAHVEAVDYLCQLNGDKWPKPEGWPSRAWSLNAYVKRALGDLDKVTDPSKIHQIVLGRWEEWPDEIVQPAIDKYGPMPLPSIEQVPLELLPRYAGRDADATLRVRPKLIELATELRRRVR